MDSKSKKNIPLPLNAAGAGPCIASVQRVPYKMFVYMCIVYLLILSMSHRVHDLHHSGSRRSPGSPEILKTTPPRSIPIARPRSTNRLRTVETGSHVCQPLNLSTSATGTTT